MAHMHYKGTGQVHSFRGLLADGTQKKIRIQGSVGAIAWRITKFELMAENPADLSQESIVKIYREEQDSIDTLINFGDAELLGAGMWIKNSQSYYVATEITIFDNTLFVRDLWLTHDDFGGIGSCNYYIELEEVKVSKAGMAQLAVAAARRLGLNP